MKFREKRLPMGLSVSEFTKRCGVAASAMQEFGAEGKVTNKALLKIFLSLPDALQLEFAEKIWTDILPPEHRTFKMALLRKRFLQSS